MDAIHQTYWLFGGAAALVLAGIGSSLIARRFGAPLLLVFLVIGMLAGVDGPGGIRFDDYGLMNALGRLEDTSIAVSRLLFSGHLLRFPGVKLVVSMGGGTLPYALARLARSHANQKGKVADPRAGFSAMYFDSCVFDAEALEFLARKAGADRIMLGSDAPFPMGDPEPMKVVEASNLTAEEKSAVLGATARKVFRLPDR